MIEEKSIKCKICLRDTPQKYQERHHLIPKSKKGKITEVVCCNCGDMLHKLFTNNELARDFNTIESIKSNDKVRKWVSWISKKSNDFSVCMKTKKKR